jgi:transposase
MIRVRHQKTMLVGKCRLRFLKSNLVISLIVSVLFRVPIKAQFCHCKEVYRGYASKASWSRLTPPRTASGQNVALSDFAVPTVAALRWRGLILIQASLAARCRAAVGWRYPNNPFYKEEAWMNFYTQQHKHYCGIDLHARAMYVGLLDQDGTKLVHKNLPTTPEAFLRVLAPYREDLGVGVECMFTWYWLADLCQQEGIAFALGHALYMKAIHGGKAKNDKIDAHKIAVLLRGGMFPQAYVYPAEMRATRDLLRRRCHLARKRAELLAHIHNTNRQYNLPEIGKRLANKSNREAVAEHFPAPSVRKTLEVEVSLIDHYDQLLGAVERSLTRSAKAHDGQTFARLQSVPGIGESLALVILYERQDISRFPRVHEFLSYGRLVKCAKASNGKKLGTSGKKIGNVHLRWALAEAAVLFLRQSQPGEAYFATLEHQHGKAKALTVLAHKLGRAVYYMLTREQVFDLQRFVTASPLRGETEPAA